MNRIPVIDMTATGINITRMRIAAGLTVKDMQDVFAHENNRNTEHISITDWADVMLVAPATADVLAKMAYGIADDALTTTFCAFDKPVLIAPAMNSKMLAHPATQEAMKRLDSFENVTMLPCAEGELACGSEGKGRMIEVEELYFAIQKALEIQRLDSVLPSFLDGRSNLPLTHGLKEEDCGAHRDVQAVQTAKHGNTDMGRCSPPPDIRKAGGLSAHHKGGSAAHVYVIVK